MAKRKRKENKEKKKIVIKNREPMMLLNGISVNFFFKIQSVFIISKIFMSIYNIQDLEICLYNFV